MTDLIRNEFKIKLRKTDGKQWMALRIVVARNMHVHPHRLSRCMARVEEMIG